MGRMIQAEETGKKKHVSAGYQVQISVAGVFSVRKGGTRDSDKQV